MGVEEAKRAVDGFEGLAEDEEDESTPDAEAALEAGGAPALGSEPSVAGDQDRPSPEASAGPDAGALDSAEPQAPA